MKKLNIMHENELLTPRSDPVPRGRQKQFTSTGGLRPLITLRAGLLLAATGLFWLFAGEAQAQVIGGGVDAGLPAWGTNISFSNPSTGGGHMADANASGTTAGLDYFANYVNVTWNTAAGVAPGDTTPHKNLVLSAAGASAVGFDVPSTPTYDTTSTWVSLQLTGCVQFPDATYNSVTTASDSITLGLFGYVNGALVLNINEVLTPTSAALTGWILGQGFITPINTPLTPTSNFIPITSQVLTANVGVIKGPNTMEDILQISSVGRVIYEASDPNPFVGEVPEPSTLALLGLGTLSLLACARRQRNAKA